MDAVRERMNANWGKAFKLLALLQIVLAAIGVWIVHRKRYFAEHLVFATFYERGARLPWVKAIVAYAAFVLFFGLLQGGTATYALVMALKRA